MTATDGNSPPDHSQITLSSDHEDNDDKSHTFRKRRLTLTKHHLQMAASSASKELADDEGSERAASRNSQPQVDDGLLKKVKLHHAEEDEATQQRQLSKRVLHAGELAARSTRVSETTNRSDHPLYQPPLRVEPVQTEAERKTMPPWRHRHHFHHDDSTLPFPREVVGTYSCHGVEPVYDSDYEPTPGGDDGDEDDEQWIMTGEPAEDNDGSCKTVSPEESPNSEPEFEQEQKLSTTAKINQDRGGVTFPYGNCARTALFAVYDGHGQGGELVSQFALHEVQRRLEKHPQFHENIEKAFHETFLAVDDDLTKEPLIEPLYAGTTACVILLRDNVLTIANVGDSRAVLARSVKSKDDEWETIDLSQDQNPDVPEEQERIENSGGFVSPPPEEGLSARVWLDCNYSQIGLAMARSIGDHAVKPVGVIADPVVTMHQIMDEDDFLIIATDGVWEFIDSEEAVRIVSSNIAGGASKACQALIEAAASRWHDEEGNYRDDITALVVRLQDLW